MERGAVAATFGGYRRPPWRSWPGARLTARGLRAGIAWPPIPPAGSPTVIQRRPGWLEPPVRGAAAISALSGFSQFAVTAVIGDVAAAFGQPGAGDDPASQIGLTATTLGVALAMVRLASLGALPGTAMADRLGRRRVLLLGLGIGLAFTAASSAAPGFWTWALLVALARPWLSTVNNVAGVLGAEETRARDRSWAVAFIGGAYGAGAGTVAILRGFLPEGGWRPAMAATALGLLAIPALGRLVREPRIWQRHADEAPTVLGTVPRGARRGVLVIALATAGMGLATGPGFTYVFVYGEKVLGASPGTMSLVILLAAPTSLAGLLAGRWAADRLGRRPTAVAGMAGTAAMVALAYSGSFPALAAGYLAALATSSAFGPAIGAMVAEVFETSIRSTATGWIAAAGVIGAVGGLALYGVLVDRLGGFGQAALVLAVPVVLASGLFALVPETRGRELDA